MSKKRRRPRTDTSPVASIATCFDAQVRLSDTSIESTYRQAKTSEHLTSGESEGLAIVRHKRRTKAVRTALGLIDNVVTQKRTASNGRKHRNARTSSDAVKMKQEAMAKLIESALADFE
jgi:hypothetical protein